MYREDPNADPRLCLVCARARQADPGGSHVFLSPCLSLTSSRGEEFSVCSVVSQSSISYKPPQNRLTEEKAETETLTAGVSPIPARDARDPHLPHLSVCHAANPGRTKHCPER